MMSWGRRASFAATMLWGVWAALGAGCTGDRPSLVGPVDAARPDVMRGTPGGAGTAGQGPSPADAAAGGLGGGGGWAGMGGAGGAAPAATAWVWTVACPDGHQPADPIDYGRCAIDQALAEIRTSASISIVVAGDPAASAAVLASLQPSLDARPESYVAATIAGSTWVVGRDAVGAMYGALEIAERLRLNGAAALPLQTSLRGAPALPVRALNIFLTMPETGETNWWYLDEQFWTQYLDLLAHARLNILDLHAMYEPNSTQFPNALLYLATAASTPEVGIFRADRERNLKMLNRIIALARARGVGVGLMTYQANTSLDARTVGVISDAPADDPRLKTYIREAMADLGTRAPDLALLGFRIGETSHVSDANWYADTFIAGAKQAHVKAQLYTRTWEVPRKTDIVALVDALGAEMLIESKYNAEHWGPPYPIAGGLFSALGYYASYSYQNYLNPPTPWGLVFQIRAGGTHRIFREASFERTARTIASLGLSPVVRGFSVEAPHAFSPQRSYYHADVRDQLSPWTFVRDDLMYLLWGRLGYDPGTPEATFRAMAARESGTDLLWDAIQAAGDIVPWIVTAHTCGLDSRDFAPEMELAGDVGQWARLPRAKGEPPVLVPSCDYSYETQYPSGPMDTFAVASPAEAAADIAAGLPTIRLSPLDVAGRVFNDADRAARGAAAIALASPSTTALARDLARESLALAALGRYFAHKLRAAVALGVYARSGDLSWLAAARTAVAAAHAAWRDLAARTSYIRPFHERLRMGSTDPNPNLLHYDPFHWSQEIPALDEDLVALDLVAKRVAAHPPAFSGPLPDPEVALAASRPPGPGPVTFAISPALGSAGSWTVQARFTKPVAAGVTVRILWKPFESEKDWTSVNAAAASDGTFSAVINGGGAGGMFAVEVRAGGAAWRYPDPLLETPYVSLAP